MQSTLLSFVAMIQTVVKYFLLLFILCFGVTSRVSANTLEHKYDKFHYVNDQEEAIKDLSFSSIKFYKNFSQDFPEYSTKKENVKPELLYFESESKNKYNSLVSLKKQLNSLDYFIFYFYDNTSSTFHNCESTIQNIVDKECLPKKHFYLLFLSIKI